MDSREIAEKARNLGIMVKVQGPDPQGLKMRGSAFHQRENGITVLSASGFLLPPSLSDSLSLLSGRQHKGTVAITAASVVEPFLPAQYRNLGYQNSTAVQVGVPGLIPGARIDISNPECGHDGHRESLAWHQARLVDVAVSSTALESLMRSNRASSNYSSWEVGWKLVSLDSSPDSNLDSLQREFKASGNKSKSDGQLDFILNESTNLHQMAMSTTKIAFLEILTLDSKDLLNVNISYQQKRGDFLMAIGSPFGVLSPSHFLNSVCVGTVANSCPPDSCDSSLLVADIRCLPGMEGGLVFDRDACLVGILTRPIRQKNCTAEIQVLVNFLHNFLPSLISKLLHNLVSFLQLVITWNAISSICSNPQDRKASDDVNKELHKGLASKAAHFQMPFQHAPRHNSFYSLEPSLEKVVTSIVLVTIGDEAWASGILLNKEGLILTNAHLLEPWRYRRSSLLNSANEPMVLSVSANEPVQLDKMILLQPPDRTSDTISVGHKTTFPDLGYGSHKKIHVRLTNAKPWIWSDAKVVYISKGPLDIALLQLDDVPHKLCAINPNFLCPSEGTKVHVIGHGPFGPQSDIGPYISSGVVTKVVRSQLQGMENAEESSPVMLQTTAAVFPGMSGGAVVNSDGQMIGLVTSNARHAGGTTIPHLNFSLPCVALKPIFNFSEQPDTSILKNLDKPNAFLSSIWALVPPPASFRRPDQPDTRNKEGKGSRFAKFLTEKHADVALPNDLKPFIKGKNSSNLLLGKL
ncbi:hypothetical protein Taro_050111 [Colocasia esculenta]|uniref:Glyoxysomal processing protease, glyoxysomal n=1 Tax=Colocasia esculenta TaxID=4460 RepID=A0A843XCY1_COLES|nr:hypothetical protein [Colocasia esculenta]